MVNKIIGEENRLDVTILIPYCLRLKDNSHLELCLTYLNLQTRKPRQIIVLDDSELKDREGIKQVCDNYGADYLEFPYVNHSQAFARKFNTGFKHSVGDAIVLLCSNWCLEPGWVEKMVDMMERRGNDCIICCDNSRRYIDNGSGNMIDWFAGYPDEFRSSDPNMMDSAFLMMIHRDSWLPWDEDFDPDPDKLDEWVDKANWHGITEWAHRLMRNNQLWIKRGLKADHIPIPRWPDRPKWERQIVISFALAKSKGVP